MTDDFSGVADLIPEGAVPLHSFRLVEYVDADGELGLKFKVDGDVALSTTIGLLEMAKTNYALEAYEDTE